MQQLESLFSGPNKNQNAAKLLWKKLNTTYPELLNRIEVLGGNFKATNPYIKVEIRLDGRIPIIYRIEFKSKQIDYYQRIRYDKDKD